MGCCWSTDEDPILEPSEKHRQLTQVLELELSRLNQQILTHEAHLDIVSGGPSHLLDDETFRTRALMTLLLHRELVGRRDRLRKIMRENYERGQKLGLLPPEDTVAKEGEETCVCCETNQAVVRMLPCSHLYICHRCYAMEKATVRGGKSCYLCRAVVQSTEECVKRV